MLARTRGSNGPVERTGGEARRQVYQALQGEAPSDTRESTRTTRNGVDFHNAVDTGCVCRFTLSDKRGKDAVSVGRDEVTGPDSRTVQEVHRNIPSQSKLTKMGGDSRAAAIDQ